MLIYTECFFSDMSRICYFYCSVLIVEDIGLSLLSILFSFAYNDSEIVFRDVIKKDFVVDFPSPISFLVGDPTFSYFVTIATID